MSTRRFLRLLTRLCPLALSSLLGFAAAFPASIVEAQQLAATYSHGSLTVTIPYDSPQDGSGKLVAEILDPEGHALSRIERHVDVRKGKGAWQQTIALTEQISFEEIVWQRLRYSFEYESGKWPNSAKQPNIDGVESISQIIRRPVIHVLGQTQYLAGSVAAVRVIVSEANSNLPQSGTLQIDLLVDRQEPQRLFSGSLNRRGTVEAGLHFPAGLMGKCQLRFSVDSPIGSTEYTQPIQLEDKASILLTTEKPLYQPGQTIHLRALALDRAAAKAANGRKLTFEIEDARGNKVFRKVTQTDPFGIASAEFSLADEVNLGAYHLRALMGEAEAPANTAEIAFQVERYVLPKFKVEVEFTQKNGKPRRDYRPGDHVTGTIHANYFFGKPVADAEITVKASAMDVAVFDAANATGKTDSDGAYRFDLKLPAYFAGRPLSQGSARALIEATVKDSAEHSESLGEPITISESPLLITAVPEGGTLIPNVENEIFLLAAYPDGSPAKATLTIHPPQYHDRIPYIGEENERDRTLSTDAAGVAVLRISPEATLESLRIDVDDHRGNKVSQSVPLESRSGSDQILLHTNRAVFKAGERIELKVLSTRARGAAYVDIVRNGQTILTRDLDLENGQAEIAVTATPEMAGTLDIDAYMFGRDAQPVADHRLAFVQPADELKIETTADAQVYRPGSEARVRFHVTNARGEGVQAALGLQVVDEAVFALAEKKPGFAKVFFFLEQEVMKPRYEIHSLSMSDVVETGGASGNESQDLAARALFSATEMANPATLDVEFGRSLPAEKFDEFQERYQAAFRDQVAQIAARLSEKFEANPRDTNISNAFETLENGAPPHDAWNTALRLDPAPRYYRRQHSYLVRSAGADRRFGTGDDLTAWIEVRSATWVGDSNQEGSIGVRMEHDRGAVNDRAEIAGTVTDMTGAVIPGAAVTLRQISAHETRTAHTDAVGSFSFAALPPGRYRVEISSRGFVPAAHEISVLPRDLATLSAVLNVGAESQTVTVQAAVAQPMLEFKAAAGRAAMGGMGAGAEMVGDQAMQPMAAPIAGEALSMLKVENGSFAVLRKAPAADEPHVRSYFPEALYINPEILTDGNGDASISIPIADSITTWRMALLASTQSGALGSGASSIKVFQDFFVDLDLPVILTQGDRVSIPVAVYNYSGSAGQVALNLEPSDWYSLDNDTPQKTLAVESGKVGGSQFTLNANRIGKFKLTLSARMDGAQGAAGRQDIVVREIEVIPNGQEQNIVFNGRLQQKASHNIAFPANAIPDASSVIVRLYPGPLSQVVEGMDSILRMPGGCFEQTSSSTYPNVLALDYMKRTGKLAPEVRAKAEGYIANGYQRLVTFEVPGGGFSWFGQAPANKILTAYGLMEFHDMSKVSDVDSRLIERTAAWLAGQQQPDGSWKPDTSFINEGATNRYNSDVLRITAYIAWSLANIGYQGPAVENAKRFIESDRKPAADPYTLAVIANFAADYGKDREFTSRAMQALVEAATANADQISWNAEETGVYSTGRSAAIETTGLAAQALLKWGQASDTARKALNFIAASKQASGDWGTTQATIMALRALLLSTELGSSQVHGAVTIALNGKTAESLQLTPENNDLFHQFVFKGKDLADSNGSPSVELHFDGDGTLAYQVVGRYFTPWEQEHRQEPLSINVSYDRTLLPQNDIATATAVVRNNLSNRANMVMVDLGIPPGFELLSEDLQSFQEKTRGQESGRLEKFSLTATQAILYFNALSPHQTITVSFRLRAKYPIRARTFSSRVYEYYDPQVSATALPVQLEVTGQR